MKNLKIYRNEKGITQIRLSIECGVSQETISAYESGKAMPSAETLIRMSNFLGVSIDYLLDKTDIPFININKNDEDLELVNLFHQLNKEQKVDVLNYIKIRKQM